MSIMDNVQPAVKKETGKVAAITGIGLILMWIVFGVLHAFMPQKVPFDYTVFLGGAVGGCVAVLNFFFMGLAVQKAAAATDEDTARMRIKASYSQRMLIQMLWVILAIVAPCFHFVAGIVPLYFPEQELKLQEFFILTNRYFYIKPEQYRERQEVNKEYGIGYQRGKDILYITH